MKLGKINRQSIAISGFTSVLKHIPVAPSSLSIIGTLPLERPPVVAIIGSRTPSAYGNEITYRFAYELAKRGVVIVSGLAYGVDAIAHQACLDAGGTTIAILAGGLHAVYPKQHTQLARDIVASGGALISEYDLGTDPRPHFFLARNRLISGLADAVLITEATHNSGTFSTVAHAIEQNKEVFAVPGPITSLLSAGPNRLIQTGAHVACEPSDILDVIAPEWKAGAHTQAPLATAHSPLQMAILDCLRRGAHDGDHLQQVACQQVPTSTSEFLQAMTLLELQGSIRPLGGNKWGIGGA